MTEESVAVELVAGTETGSGAVLVKRFSDAERVTRALRIGAVVLAATAAAILVPVAHFILVPLGIILTPIVAWLNYRVRAVCNAGSIKCPACDKAFELTQRPWAPRLFENCPGCSREIEIKQYQG